MMEQHLKLPSEIGSFGMVYERTTSRVRKYYLCLVDVSPCCIISCWSIGYEMCCGHQPESKEQLNEAHQLLHQHFFGRTLRARHLRNQLGLEEQGEGG